MSKTLKKTLYYALPCILIVASFFTAFNKTIWVDEAFSLEIANHSIAEIISIDATDVHPPLYYLILKLAFLIFGSCVDHIYVGKIVSLIPYILLLAIGFTIIKEKFGCLTAFLFNIFIVGMPQMLNYSTEVRMYSWGMFFVTCAYLQASSLWNEEKSNFKNYIFLAIFATLAAYTHYFACASAIVIYFEILVISLLKKDKDVFFKTILSGVAVVIMYLPWLFVFINQTAAVSESYWIEPISKETIKGYFQFLFFSNGFIGKLIYVLIFLAIAGCIKASNENKIVILCAIGVWFGTIMLGIIMSVIIRPVFIAKYMMGSAACLWLGIAIALGRLSNDKRIYYALSLVAIVLCFSIGINYVVDDYEVKTNTEETLKKIGESIDGNTMILSDFNHVQRTVSYFFPENESLVYNSPLTDLTLKTYSDCNLGKIEELSDLANNSCSKILVLDYENNDENLKEDLEQQGYTLESIGSYWLDYYNFTMYLIEQ